MTHLLRLSSLFILFGLFANTAFANDVRSTDTGSDIRLFCELKAKTNNFLPGETVQFEARIVNNTQQTVTNIRVIDFAPVGFIVKESKSVEIGEQVILSTTKPIPPGKDHIIKFAAHIDEDLIPGLYTNLCKVVYAENEKGQAIINDSQKWTSSPWDMQPTEALDFIRVLDPVTNENSKRNESVLYFKVIQTQYHKDRSQVQVDFSDDDNSSISYKLFSDDDRLKSTGRIDGVEGLNTLNLDASYLEAGEYLLEMNDGTDSISTRFSIK